MKTSEFDYQLPEGLIATHPAEPRDSARLMLVNRKGDEIKDAVFSDLANILGPNDVLVLNNSKVIPARIFGAICNRSFEVLLVKQSSPDTWECFVRNGKKLAENDELTFGEVLKGTYLRRQDEIFYIQFNYSGAQLFKELVKVGEMPIPPYILKARQEKHDELEDNEDYQTVYAKSPGSVAAPTAGLHFTDELLSTLVKNGVQIEYVTLHVGLGTFQPLNTESVEEFTIHSEYYEIDPGTANRLNEAKMANKRVIAVGTTSVRVLESAATEIQSCGFANRCSLRYGLLPKSGETQIYIYPGYEYKFVDAMITNFHLPKSSLLLLVSAFAGTRNIKDAYAHAIEEKYHFYSYGDAMFIY